MTGKFEERTDEELVELAKRGDTSATEEILHRYAGTVRICARRYFLVGGETDDLVQEGMIGLYKAIGDYDADRERGNGFKNFAYLCVSRRILSAVKSVYRKKNGAMYTLQPLDSAMVETGLGPEELLILSDEQKEFRQKMGRVLSDFEFKVTAMYMDGMTCAEICEGTGKQYKSVDNAIQRSKRKLLQFIKK